MSGTLELHSGDITALAVDAIVNAANSALRPGGGVDGAINRAAGPDLARDMAALGGCPTGEARITPGFALKARHVIHAVGPVWHGGGHDEDILLSSAYRSALALADVNGLDSVAFPAISTGVYGFPMERAAGIAVDTCRGWQAEHAKPGRIIFCVFGDAAAAAYRTALAGLSPTEND
jgi:O-acetyl-ADP-ribose deacetylase (regulator of RNase III)